MRPSRQGQRGALRCRVLEGQTNDSVAATGQQERTRVLALLWPVWLECDLIPDLGSGIQVLLRRGGRASHMSIPAAAGSRPAPD